MWLLLIIILLLWSSLAPTKCYLENFAVYPYNYKEMCPACHLKDPEKCMSCLNCGLCVKADGTKKCVSGDSSGPYFNNNCLYYSYGRERRREISPSVQVRSIYPN